MNRIRTTNAVCKMIYMSDKICPVFHSGAISDLSSLWEAAVDIISKTLDSLKLSRKEQNKN